MIRDVSDLEVYGLSLNNLKLLYEFLRKVTKSEYDTVRNCKRAGKSIPTNLSEGWGKRSSEATFKNHLKICIGSSDEVVTHLRTAAIAVPRLAKESGKLGEMYKILSRRLNRLHKVWRTGKF